MYAMNFRLMFDSAIEIYQSQGFVLIKTEAINFQSTQRAEILFMRATSVDKVIIQLWL